VRAERHVEPGCCCPEQSAGDSADAPEGVQAVDDRPAVGALHPEAVGVLRDVDDRVEPTDQQHDRGKTDPSAGERQAGDCGREGDQPEGGDPGRAEAADGHGREESGEQRADRHGGDSAAVGGVAEVERSLDLGEPRDEVRVQDGVDEEHR
jgi:hypothetical protein